MQFIHSYANDATKESTEMLGHKRKSSHPTSHHCVSSTVSRHSLGFDTDTIVMFLVKKVHLGIVSFSGKEKLETMTN